ncbi:MAG: CoA transferase [bacterium]
MSGPLEGLKVLDLSRFIAGPYCGMMLADMGADVVKVERPGRGEDTRTIDPKIEGESLYVMVFNRNKRGMTLDFRNSEAQELLRSLVVKADVLIENFRPGTMEKMGCGWDELKAINPRLVMIRISGFGQDGPYAQRPCFDVIAQAMSGLMEMTGEPDGPPVMAGSFIVDFVTALYATIAALGAIHAREKTGRGQLIDSCLLESAVSLLMTAIPEYVLLGRETTRRGTRDRYSAPANNFQAKDGHWLHLATGNDTLFERFCNAAGMPDLLDDPRFNSHAIRMTHFKEIEEIVARWVADLPAEEVVRQMEKAGVPCAKVATIAEVVANPQLQHRGYIVELEQAKMGRLPMQGLPFNLSDTPCEIRRAAPSIGQHTREILKDWLSLSDSEIERLVAESAV